MPRERERLDRLVHRGGPDAEHLEARALAQALRHVAADLLDVGVGADAAVRALGLVRRPPPPRRRAAAAAAAAAATAPPAVTAATAMAATAAAAAAREAAARVVLLRPRLFPARLRAVSPPLLLRVALPRQLDRTEFRHRAPADGAKPAAATTATAAAAAAAAAAEGQEGRCTH